jgi:hypothetical protein
LEGEEIAVFPHSLKSRSNIRRGRAIASSLEQRWKESHINYRGSSIQQQQVNKQSAPYEYMFTRCFVSGPRGEALRYKPEGNGFNSLWSHWNFSFT